MKIFVVARSNSYAKAFVDRHNFAANNIEILLGQKSYFKVLNKIIRNNDNPVLVVHDDIYFSREFYFGLDIAVEKLNKITPLWGVAGNAGIACSYFGLVPTQIVRYIYDPHGGPNLSGNIIRAQSIDGNTMLLNIPILKNFGVKLPNINGFQFYDLSMSIEVLKHGLGVYISSDLLCMHNSRGNQKEFDAALKTNKISNYLNNTIRNKYLMTLNGRIDLDNPIGKVDIIRNSILRISNQKIRVAIVVRTQFNRPELLFRCLSSVVSFIAASGSSNIYSCYIITDKKSDQFVNIYDLPIIFVKTELKDTRLKLLISAFNKIEADYYWFVDDDDWLFPNNAEILTDLLCSFPKKTTVYVDAQTYKESYIDNSFLNLKSSPLRYFNTELFYNNFSGENQVPICGIIFPKLDDILNISDQDISDITFGEDYFIQMINMFSEDYFPICTKLLLSGISIRDSGNTVTLLDRTQWNISFSAVFNKLVKNKRSLLFSNKILSDNSIPTPSIREDKVNFIKKESLTFLRFKLFKYRIMKAITWGNKKIHYKKKRDSLRNLLRD